jgi:hypothetical protein
VLPRPAGNGLFHEQGLVADGSIADRRLETATGPAEQHRCERWRDSESNRGHYDFQSYALPTELSRPEPSILAPSRPSGPPEARPDTEVVRDTSAANATLFRIAAWASIAGLVVGLVSLAATLLAR